MKIIVDLDKYIDLKFIEKAVITFLNTYYIEHIGQENYEYIEGYQWVAFPVKLLAEKFGLSRFQQREIQATLEQAGYITVRFGQSRVKYYRLYSKRKPSKKQQLLKVIKRVSDSEIQEDFLVTVLKDIERRIDNE